MMMMMITTMLHEHGNIEMDTTYENM